MALGAQTLYKSVGPDGRIVYSDRPPAEGRLEKTITFENLPSSPLPAATSSYVEQLRRTSASSSADTPTNGVVLYAAAWCGFCKRAKAYLAGKGVQYQEFDIDTKDGMAAFARAGGGKGVPLLIADGRRVQGFSPAAYDALFAHRK
jgi:glutaredoxin